MKDKNKISTLFLDIGGVMLSKGWGHEFRQEAAKKFHLDYDELADRHTTMFNAYEEGKITLDEYLDRVIFYKNRDFTHQQFKEYMFSLTTEIPKMIALFKKLKEVYKLRIIVVSNEGGELNGFRIHKFKLNQFVDFFVSSCYVGMRKPDPGIFRLAIDGAQVPLEEILYIDDSQIYVDVATDLGIPSIRHTDFESTCKKLKDLGLNID